jgi:hypothetical protein
MKTRLAAILTFTILFSLPAHANWLEDIFKATLKVYGVNLEMKGINQSQLDETRDIKKISQSQLNEVQKISGGLTGTHQYGSQFYDPNKLFWGKGGNDWQSILALTHAGGGEGTLGSAIRQLSSQFPIRGSLGSSNDTENEYYRLQAQTSLASRASAQTAFDQMKNQDDTMKQLHNMIDKTPDNKSSVDLNNRLSEENISVNMQQVKLLAVLAQQLAIDSQEKANRANESAEFFNIK